MCLEMGRAGGMASLDGQKSTHVSKEGQTQTIKNNDFPSLPLEV